MMIWIVNAKHLDDYKVQVEFNDGVIGIINFLDILGNDKRMIIRELLDLNKFKTVRVDYDTLCWDNGVDFAPEFLYDKIRLKEVA
ncbi:hypothetical protein FACS189434_12230 [Bacteroidia bacterium]|nr:hypothetical protein FACS189434_12230 [Bacteroidia bacterium]